MDSHTAIPRDIESEAQQQKTALLFRNAGLAQSVHVINASLLAYICARLHTAWALALGWWLATVSVAVWRYALSRAFLQAPVDVATAPRWRQRYLVATTCSAVAWPWIVATGSSP